MEKIILNHLQKGMSLGTLFVLLLVVFVAVVAAAFALVVVVVVVVVQNELIVRKVVDCSFFPKLN